MKKNTASLVVSWFIGGLLIYAAMGKLMEPKDFERALSVLGGRNNPLVIALELIVPAFELALGVFLLLRIHLRWSAGVALLAFALGSGVVAALQFAGADCGCFPMKMNPVNVWLNEYPATRNALLALMSVFLLANEAIPPGGVAPELKSN